MRIPPDRNVSVFWTPLICTALVFAFTAMNFRLAGGGGETAERVASLTVGDAVFWDGEYTKRGRATYSYEVWIEEAGGTLRVAIDVPTRTDWYRVTIVDPEGRRRAKVWKRYAFSAEARIPDPGIGSWGIEVTADDVSESAFRMRAKLTALPAKQRNSSPNLPDLRVVPPYEFTFSAPDDGAGSDYDNDSSDEWPPRAISCAADETLEEGAVRCLRFSAGLENAGLGPLDLRFDTMDEERRVFQIIHYDDGRVKRRTAGRFAYHTTHNHFHYENAWTFTLLAVLDRDAGRMKRLGSSRKGGFCPVDQKLARWRRFSNAPRGSFGSDCGMTYQDTPVGSVAIPNTGTSFMGFSTGWGDVYGWYRPGNYVTVDSDARGYFVIRAIADAMQAVREQSEHNNQGYALVHIDGDRIRLIERGRGSDPFDPNRVVLDPWWKRLGP